ncbi:MAG: endonuclease/exonuclease/phosphatase family protein, partial [Bacteroidota bacterium]
MLRFFHRTWLFLSILSFGSAFIPPKLLWLAGVWTFTIPIFGIGLFVFLLVYLLRREKRSLLYTLLVFLLGIPHWLATVNFSFSTDESGTDLKVLSYNLHYFYSADKLRFVPEQRETFMAFIKNEQPDFLCLQEFHDPGQRLSKWLQKKGYTNQRFLWIRPERGLAIFSRFPITSYQETSFENSPQNGCQQVNIDLQNGKSLSLVNVHLQSFILRNFNKMRLRKVNDLIHALGQGMIHQSEQVEWLLSENKSNTSAILICGDHNST